MFMKTHRFRKGFRDGRPFPQTRKPFVMANQRRLEGTVQHLKECKADPELQWFRVGGRDRTFSYGLERGSLRNGPFPPDTWADLFVAAATEIRPRRVMTGRARRKGSPDEAMASNWYHSRGRFGHVTALPMAWATLILLVEGLRELFPTTYDKRRRYLERREAKKRASPKTLHSCQRGCRNKARRWDFACTS